MAYSVFSEREEAKHKAHDTGKDYGESGKEVECVRLVSIWTIAQVHPPPSCPTDNLDSCHLSSSRSVKGCGGVGVEMAFIGRNAEGSALVLVKIYLRTGVKDYKGIYFIL